MDPLRTLLSPRVGPVVILLLPAIAVGIGWAADVIGFHYAAAFDNEPLNQPVRVASVISSDQIRLEDGRQIHLYYSYPDLPQRLRKLGGVIEVSNILAGDDGTARAWVCFKRESGPPGDPRLQKPVRIPLFPIQYPRYKKVALLPPGCFT